VLHAYHDLIIIEVLIPHPRGVTSTLRHACLTVYDVGAPDTPGNEFGRWLEEALYAAGYRSVRALGRESGVDPSLINRWIKGETQPTATNLRKLARPLRIEEADVYAAAFGSEVGVPLPPLALEVTRLLGPDSPLGDRERELLTELLDRVLAPYRKG
jgi:transcriptional regulator with XRE-family HTH domain